MSRNTLANANQRRDWRIYAEFAQAMIRIARPLYGDEDLGLELDNTVYALDASTIDLCLSVFPWALFRSTKSAVKLHTLLDLRGNIPTFIHVSDGKMHDVNVLDILVPEPGAFYIMDRGYVDFERLFLLHSVGAFFIIRAKSNTRYERRYSHPVDKTTGVRCDQTVVLTGAKGCKHYPQPLRRIKYYDAGTEKTFNVLTNHFVVSAPTVAQLYRHRWQVELFFKWIKQHLRIKSFFGTSENAVKTQIWIAVTVYVLVAVLRKRLGLSDDLYTILAGFEPDSVRENAYFQAVFRHRLQFIESRKSQPVDFIRIIVGTLVLWHETSDQDLGDAFALFVVVERIAQLLDRHAFEIQHPAPSSQRIRHLLHEAELLRACEDELPVRVPVLVDLDLEIAKQPRGVLNLVDEERRGMSLEERSGVFLGKLCLRGEVKADVAIIGK